MKKFSLYLLAAGLIVSAGCGKDSPEEELVGVWKASKLVSTGCTDTNENQNLTFTNGCYIESAVQLELCLTFEFKSDNTYVLTTSSKIFGSTDTDVETGTFSVVDGKLRTCVSGSDCEDGAYSLDGNTLTLSASDPDTKCSTVLTMKR